MKRKIIYLCCFTFIFLSFKNYTLVLNSTVLAVELWLNKVFPYLFIMIVINDILIKANFSKVFKNPSTYIFIMSILSGTPSSAYIAGNMTRENKISKQYGNTTLLFTYFNNPLFLYTILSNIFSSQFIAFKLMIIHYLSNLIIYLYNKKHLNYKMNNQDVFKFNLSSAIKAGINTTTMILGTIVFYLVLSNVLLNTIKLPLALTTILRGILEITQGLNALINTPIISKELIAMFFISFGGLSIHTQVKCILDEYNLDYKYFLKGRILQTIIALFLTLIT